MATLILYVLTTTAMYYLGARAMITKWLWSKYPPWLDYYTSCAACSGFLYGIVVAIVLGWTQNLSFLGLDSGFWLTPVISGLCSMVWTPILANVQIDALYRLGVADPRAQDAQDPGAQEAK